MLVYILFSRCIEVFSKMFLFFLEKFLLIGMNLSILVEISIKELFDFFETYKKFSQFENLLS